MVGTARLVCGMSVCMLDACVCVSCMHACVHAIVRVCTFACVCMCVCVCVCDCNMPLPGRDMGAGIRIWGVLRCKDGGY